MYAYTLRGMAHYTRGRKLLLQWVSEDPAGRTQTAIGRALGVTQPSVADWMSGKSRPKPDQRVGLERLSGGAIERDSWMTPGERKRLDAVRPMGGTGTNG